MAGTPLADGTSSDGRGGVRPVPPHVAQTAERARDPRAAAAEEGGR